jgi:VanZ family protein
MPCVNRIQTYGPNFLRWIPGLIIMTVIFLLSSTPSNQIPNFGTWDVLVKKGSHLLGYGLLAQSYRYGFGGKKLNANWKAGSLAILYAISDEIHQSFIPGRNASVMDIGIDTIGILLSLLGAYVYFRSRRVA